MNTKRGSIRPEKPKTVPKINAPLPPGQQMSKADKAWEGFITYLIGDGEINIESTEEEEAAYKEERRECKGDHFVRILKDYHDYWTEEIVFGFLKKKDDK